MRASTLRRSFVPTIALLLLSAFSIAQSYQFRLYNVDNGISQPYVYTVNQDKNGFLWIGTGEGLCKFDGHSFQSFYSKDGIAENFVTASFRDSQRNLWLGHYQGSLTFYDGKKFKTINTEEFIKSPITSIQGDDKGYVWCATQNDGVCRISRSFETQLYNTQFNDENVFSLGLTRDNKLLAGTASGIMVFTLATEKREPEFLSMIEGIPQTRIQRIVRKNNSGSFWICTEDQGLFLLTPTAQNSFKVERIGANIGAGISNIQDIVEDSQGNLWLATFGNGVVKLLLNKSTLRYEEFLRFSEDNGLGNRYTKSIYSDHENNIWVGTYGSGIVQLSDNYFSFYQSAGTSDNSIHSILVTEQGRWFGTGSALAFIPKTGSSKWRMFNERSGFVNDKVTAIHRSDSSSIIIGTENNGAWIMDLDTETFRKLELHDDPLSKNISSITGSNDTYWIATRNGIFKVQPHKKMTTHFSTGNGLPHNNINQIILDHKGNLLVGTHSNLLTIIDDRDNVSYRKVYDGSDLLSITGIIEDEEHNVWISTFGNGIFLLQKERITQFTSQQGLKTNYCYSITQDGSKNIWVGHRLGLSRLRPGKNTVDIFDKADGIPGDCNYNASFRESGGNVWFGTTGGAVKYDPHKDKKNTVPPIINIRSIRINDKEIDQYKDTTLPYDDYRLRIDFIGLSYRTNSRVSYQYKLEGFDVDWSDRTYENFAQYGKLSAGEYTFLLRAFNNDGVSTQVPFDFRITIEPPFWKRGWFIVLSVLLCAYVLYSIVKVRERRHRRFQAELKKALNEKTREVIAQKEEIERKNKDITDSIRYAKRIQDAILSDVGKLRNTFPSSFVFFQPRDIVSGDFYWFERYGSKLIVACADATGHGVPGAFMSMIGSTLLKDITARAAVQSPAHALKALDAEIRILLNQGDEYPDHTHDSIDIVICEIDTDTLMTRICSTKRPVFARINGTLIMIRKELSEVQEYETTDIQLSPQDILYLFTDGYPDQFGGSKGKKIKASNLRAMLEQITNLPMEEQALAIDRYFNRWKEGYDQVDDVLFIGIQVQ